MYHVLNTRIVTIKHETMITKHSHNNVSRNKQ